MVCQNGLVFGGNQAKLQVPNRPHVVQIKIDQHKSNRSTKRIRKEEKVSTRNSSGTQNEKLKGKQIKARCHILFRR